MSGSSLQRSRAECSSLHQSSRGRSETRANSCPRRASPDSGERVNRKNWVTCALVAGEAARLPPADVTYADLESLAAGA